MGPQAMQSALSQMQQLANQASGEAARGPQASAALGGAAGAEGRAGSFAGELQASIQRINRLQQASAAKSAAFQAGDPGVELNDVMVDMQKSSVAFQMGLQVRNRLVTAYRDVMNMQV